MEAGLSVRQIYLPESLTVSPSIVDHVRPDQVVWLSDPLMKKVGYGDSYRHVVAEFDRPKHSLEQLPLHERALILVLDRIEKPGNVGALFRCADAAGVDAVLLCESGDVFNPNAIRSSIGTVFHVPFAEGTETELRSFLAKRNVRVVATRVESSRSLWRSPLGQACAIVVGSEASGLDDRWQSTPDQPVDAVRIPMAGRIDSLNVSVSAAVVLFEALRQRTGTNSLFSEGAIDDEHQTAA